MRTAAGEARERRSTAGGVGRDQPRSSPPVLCYHRVGGPLELGVTRVGRRVFARQMRALAAAGWRTLSLAEYVAEIASPNPGGSALASAFLLTFDDGYADLATFAYPLLAGLGFTATTFLITDFVGRENRWDVQYTWRRLRHLDWPAIEAWRARGFDFGSHGASHRRLTWVPAGVLADELTRSRVELAARLGPDAARAVAYPFGAADDREIRAAAAAGYAVAFTGVRGDPANPFRQPRVPVYVWDAFATPLGLQTGRLGSVGRRVAHLANRCSVGTSWMLRMVGRREQ